MRRKIYGLTAMALSGALILSACGNSVPQAATAAQESTANESTMESSETSHEKSGKSVSDTASSTTASEYVSKLFDTSYVHTIAIEIAEDDWSDLIANPTDKTKYKVNVTIDGEKVDEVALSTKGNTSLSSIASDDTTDRYSFKINFGKYVDDQTYYGLDKLNLNNIYADATYIKDYLSYQLFNHMDVAAPLTSFINVTVNGESQGLYLAIEDVDDSFLERTGNSEGELYKPETAGLANMGNGGPGKGGMQPPEGFDGQMPEFGEKGGRPDGAPEGFDGQMPSFGNGEIPEGFGGPGGFGGNDSGASLKYTDDEIESYSDIFDNAETKVNEEDQKRLIAALKNLSEGNVSDSVDIDSVINYFVVHNFVMNYDSYTGNMLHNYYLYEADGKLQMIPWDYNLAFGAFMNMGGGPQGNPFDNANADQNGGSTDKNNSASSDKSGDNSKTHSAVDKNSGKQASKNSENNATYIINYGIDSPLSGAQKDDRPMWSWITSSDEYLTKYHERFAELVEYVTSDEFTAELDRLYEMLLPYVEKDATAFYTADEFKTAFETIKEFIALRAESIKKQLNGELSAKTDEQDESARVDASGITISDMGSQGGGEPKNNRGGDSGNDDHVGNHGRRPEKGQNSEKKSN
ncbi:hypothetical protein BXO88_10520 [Oribacterium sp. C9]|uniref:CotH kinase family protein n=1 Tax=Oribacterium sp. C9 TaxID=1943579 RepID=UPI0009902F1E|nr:CotH kinase family protein [Oribacterium sp. C9]OON85862.1 hypothetical protein BXO88_10520 [Oribacterium sp. C9]